MVFTVKCESFSRLIISRYVLYNKMKRWCEEAGGEIEMCYIHKEPKAPLTAIDQTNPFWMAFKGVTDELYVLIRKMEIWIFNQFYFLLFIIRFDRFRNLKIKTLIFPGGTDSRYVRRVSNTTLSIFSGKTFRINNRFVFQANIPALGFSPMNHTPILLHDHDEYHQADIYLNGIEIYKKIIPALANV